MRKVWQRCAYLWIMHVVPVPGLGERKWLSEVWSWRTFILNPGTKAPGQTSKQRKHFLLQLSLFERVSVTYLNNPGYSSQKLENRKNKMVGTGPAVASQYWGMLSRSSPPWLNGFLSTTFGKINKWNDIQIFCFFHLCNNYSNNTNEFSLRNIRCYVIQRHNKSLKMNNVYNNLKQVSLVIMCSCWYS